MNKLHVHFLYVFICTTLAIPDTEITTDSSTTHLAESDNIIKKSEENVSPNTVNSVVVVANDTRRNPVEVNTFTRIFIAIIGPFKRFFSAPKVTSVIKNIGTCTVNGVMEIISYYMPAPLIPLIAAAAGTIIPFEPVVMLREKMPVTSYRRAFKKALNSFLGTFDKYKIEDNFDDDPYMTLRFNRRFMNLGKNEGKKQTKKDSADSEE